MTRRGARDDDHVLTGFVPVTIRAEHESAPRKAVARVPFDVGCHGEIRGRDQWIVVGIPRLLVTVEVDRDGVVDPRHVARSGVNIVAGQFRHHGRDRRRSGETRRFVQRGAGCLRGVDALGLFRRLRDGRREVRA